MAISLTLTTKDPPVLDSLVREAQAVLDKLTCCPGAATVLPLELNHGTVRRVEELNRVLRPGEVFALGLGGRDDVVTVQSTLIDGEVITTFESGTTREAPEYVLQLSAALALALVHEVSIEDAFGFWGAPGMIEPARILASVTRCRPGAFTEACEEIVRQFGRT